MSAPHHVLLLDDSPLVLNATRAALEAGGFQVSTTETAAEFLTLLTQVKPHLALVDVSMPGMEGDSVVWIARAHRMHTCPIVFYSAKSEAELAALVASTGAEGYVCKTDDAELLCEKVKGFIDAR
jgi:DNA-binding response OmpR family regulator